jgi:hypothetical protein
VIEERVDRLRAATLDGSAVLVRRDEHVDERAQLPKLLVGQERALPRFDRNRDLGFGEQPACPHGDRRRSRIAEKLASRRAVRRTPSHGASI